MPPKKAKKTKKQIEEEKKKLEEEKRIQEELDRKREEEEAKKRTVEEEKRRVEEEKRRAEEEKRLFEEREKWIERDSVMAENRVTAAKAKRKDLDEKYLLCDPLPDPENEKDLTTFITMWSETKDKSLEECVIHCQTSEEVIRQMQNILGNALSNYNISKVEWCNEYMHQMRQRIFEKYDDVTAYILEYIEDYTKYTKDELQRQQNMPPSRKTDSNQKSEFILKAHSRDIKFGIFGSVSGKNQTHKFTDIGSLQIKIPRQHANQQIIIRTVWTSFDYVSSNYGHYQPDIVVGGITDFRLFQYPEGPRAAMKWTMRNVFSVSDRLKNIPYPDPTTQIQTDPIAITYNLPDYVFTTENDDVKVAVWDEKEQLWQTELIDDILYDRTARKLEFTTRKLAQMAYLQSRCTDYPYKKWKLRCVENEKAILDIETKRLTLTFEIGPDYLMLIEKTDPEFKDIIDKKFEPGFLLMELSKCGIHLMPVDEDAKLGGIHLKDGATEERAILDVASSLRALAIRSSKWNKGVNTDNIVLKIRDNLEFDREFYEDHEPDWKYMMWWTDKCAFVNVSDASEQCDTSIKAGHETHGMLNICIPGQFTEEAIDRCHQYSYIDFMDTIKKTLRITRLLSFT
eukprot:403333299